MCTLAFEYQKEHLTIGFNRDEITERNLAYAPQYIQKNNINILAPIDPVGSGTWIGINQYGRVACLMNHNHYKHQYNLNYLHSRGQLVLDILGLVHEQPFFYVQTHAAYFAPFHLFVFDTENAFRVTWNGFELHFYSVFYGSYSFSSATLYSQELSVQRDVQWKSITHKQQQQYEEFLTTCRIGKTTNPLGKDVATVSFTWLTRRYGQGIVQYQPLYPQTGNKILSEIKLSF